MSRISVHRTPAAKARQRAFTLTEILIALTLAAIVMAAVFAAYIFVARNLTRLMNLQEQEMESRRTLRYFTTDVGSAITFSSANSSSLTLTKPGASGNVTVSYTYTAGTGTLTRTESGNTQTMLTGLTSFSFAYYNDSGSAISPGPQSVKMVEFLANASAGTANNGTQAKYTTASPRVVARNKQPLQ